MIKQIMNFVKNIFHKKKYEIIEYSDIKITYTGISLRDNVTGSDKGKPGIEWYDSEAYRNYYE